MITDTNAFPLLTQAQYLFLIEDARESKIKEIPCFEFDFVYENEAGLQTWKKKMFKNQIGGLLKACGCKEVSPGRFDWEVEQVRGKYIKCNVVHDKLLSGKVIEVLIDIEAAEAPAGIKNTEEKAWDE